MKSKFKNEWIPFNHCISFLELIYQITTNLVAEDNRNFSHSSGGQRPAVRRAEPSPPLKALPCHFQLPSGGSYVPWLEAA